MSNQEFPPPNKSNVNVFREYFSSFLAFVIVGAFLIMVGVSLPVAFNGSDEAMTRAKDLLTLVSPFAGMVIGYYFNKATSDARAESAERTAKEAAQTAQKAAVDREKAVESAQTSLAQAEAMRTDLLEMWNAANDMVQEMPVVAVDQEKKGPELEGIPEALLSVLGSKTMWKLQEALKRAEKWK